MSKDLYSRLDILTTMLLYFFLFLLTRLFRRVKLSATVQLLPRKWFLTLYFPISFLLFFWLRSSGIFLFSSYTEAILSGIILTNLPIIYFLYASIIQTYEEQRALDKALTQTKAQLSRYRYSIELEEQLKKERHELKNHYFYMQTLLKEQKHEELEHYLEEITGEKLASISTISTGNVLMDYLLNKKMKETQKYHIKTYTEILVPEQLHVNDDVLCTILLNLLDNAIEASRQEESSDIHITIKCIPDYLICKISNKVNRDILLENPNLHTTKSDPQNHGLGMKIIKDAVDSCNGIFHTSMEDNYFTASVMLPLNN
jgi:sensor histidine kinase regulating citrate/malate metabolism